MIVGVKLIFETEIICEAVREEYYSVIVDY